MLLGHHALQSVTWARGCPSKWSSKGRLTAAALNSSMTARVPSHPLRESRGEGAPGHSQDTCEPSPALPTTSFKSSHRPPLEDLMANYQSPPAK